MARLRDWSPSAKRRGNEPFTLPEVGLGGKPKIRQYLVFLRIQGYDGGMVTKPERRLSRPSAPGRSHRSRASRAARMPGVSNSLSRGCRGDAPVCPSLESPSRGVACGSAPQGEAVGIRITRGARQIWGQALENKRSVEITSALQMIPMAYTSPRNRSFPVAKHPFRFRRLAAFVDAGWSGQSSPSLIRALDASSAWRREPSKSLESDSGAAIAGASKVAQKRT